MGRPEVTRSSQDDKLEQGVHIGLPLKITGIVFWGLVAIGLVVVAEAMHWLQRDMDKAQLEQTQQTTLMIQALVQQNGLLAIDVLQPRLDMLVQSTSIIGISIQKELNRIAAGDSGPHLTRYTRHFSVNQPVDDSTDVITDVWMMPTAEVLAPQKKRLMMEMGLLVFAFGSILQLILQKLLTNPITRMVSAAHDRSLGGTTQFDETRRDEFGYLARFINRALDNLTQRQDEAVTALKRALASEQALSEEKERAEVTLHSIAEGVITTDKGGHIQYMNPAAENLCGHRQADAVGRAINHVMKLKDEHGVQALESSILECLRTDEIVRALKGRTLVRSDGKEIAIEENAAPIRDHSGQTIGAVLAFEDVRQTRELTRKLSYQASHDTLTGLFNRYEFENRLREALELARVENTPITLCYMDLDQFKLVNDTCGHIAGDELLRQLSHMLKDELRDSDIIARLGGDEFGVLLPGCSLGSAERLASKLRESVREYTFMWDGKSFEVGVSIGVVPISADTQDVTEALSAADVACYAAKENGRDCVHIYEADDDALQRKRSDMQWVSRIRQALKEDRFQLFQQPIVPVSKNKNNIACHHEVLLRMLDEKGELIAPGQFLGAAEQFGLMIDIDTWVLRHALDWLSTQTTEHQEHHLAINLSGQSMSSNSFLDNVIIVLKASGVNPRQICFEITETAAIADLDNATRFIKALRNMGCEFALDDFGSGMSSFAYLKNLPVNYLKIDGSYVRDVVKNPIDRSMVEAVNQIGHAMGIKTIAEFVEDEATLGALAVIGVDYAQGYGIAKPAPLENLSTSNVTPLRKA
jgi:diguanylate cyclase (GGDEF)-like protein/PAS domain S-box-containing protein